jgi:hypothetical protein
MLVLLLLEPFFSMSMGLVIIHNLLLGIAIYRVSQEERKIFWDVIVSVILSKKLYMNMYPIPNGFRDGAILVGLGRPVLSFPPTLLREGRSIFSDVIVLDILSKNFVRTCVLFRTVSEIEPFDCIVVWLGVPVLSIRPVLLCYV